MRLYEIQRSVRNCLSQIQGSSYYVVNNGENRPSSQGYRIKILALGLWSWVTICQGTVASSYDTFIASRAVVNEITGHIWDELLFQQLFEDIRRSIEWQ